jgi:hypothetical protein
MYVGILDAAGQVRLHRPVGQRCGKGLQTRVKTPVALAQGLQ